MSTPAETLSDTSLLATLTLWRCENVGPVTFRKLLETYGTAEKALDILPELARAGGRKRPIKQPDPAKIEAEIDATHRLGGRYLGHLDPAFPPLLKAAEDAPPVIGIVGDATLFQRRAVGIVGARNASLNGRKLAAQLATELGQAGFVVVSGLARGIDTAAHQGSLATGTLACLAGGLDNFYPRENEELQRRIAEAGCLVTEQPPATRPTATHFPRRNRIISGLSEGVLVVEAAARSGSLITARLAGEQGREVMAIPGSPMDARASGGNRLIKEGAALIEGIDDILDVLSNRQSPSLFDPGYSYDPPPPPPLPDGDTLSRARTRILDALDHTGISVDELIRDCATPAQTVQIILLELELAGRLTRLPGNRVCIKE
ncbi:MAG: DNA-processing protein DprA [Alphaproteobacteria bacterium]